MRRVAVQSAVLHAKGMLVLGRVAMGVIAVVVLAKHARCTLSRVRAVGMRHRCLSNHEGTSPSIAATVTRRKALAALMTADRAGKPDERSQSYPW